VKVKPKYAFDELATKLALPFMPVLALFLGYLAFLIAPQQIPVIFNIFTGHGSCPPGILHGALLHDGN
jgi:hypothetical protein